MYTPFLVTKYNLMTGSTVEDLFMDEDMIVVQAWANVET
jgi:hypothetical protein